MPSNYAQPRSSGFNSDAVCCAPGNNVYLLLNSDWTVLYTIWTQISDARHRCAMCVCVQLCRYANGSWHMAHGPPISGCQRIYTSDNYNGDVSPFVPFVFLLAVDPMAHATTLRLLIAFEVTGTLAHGGDNELQAVITPATIRHGQLHHQPKRICLDTHLSVSVIDILRFFRFFQLDWLTCQFYRKLIDYCWRAQNKIKYENIPMPMMMVAWVSSFYPSVWW